VNLAEPAQREPDVPNSAHTRIPEDSCVRPQGSDCDFVVGASGIVGARGIEPLASSASRREPRLEVSQGSPMSTVLFRGLLDQMSTSRRREVLV
jgi:hypothetical protein